MRDGKNISRWAQRREKVLISHLRWSMVWLSLVRRTVRESLFRNYAMGLSSGRLTLSGRFRIRGRSVFQDVE